MLSLNLLRAKHLSRGLVVAVCSTSLIQSILFVLCCIKLSIICLTVHSFNVSRVIMPLRVLCEMKLPFYVTVSCSCFSLGSLFVFLQRRFEFPAVASGGGPRAAAGGGPPALSVAGPVAVLSAAVPVSASGGGLLVDGGVGDGDAGGGLHPGGGGGVDAGGGCGDGGFITSFIAMCKFKTYDISAAAGPDGVVVRIPSHPSLLTITVYKQVALNSLSQLTGNGGY